MKRSGEDSKGSKGPAGEAGRGYHHGDLRRRLIDVGERLLEEAGVEGFTLRECARRAGVSPSAPSHHFGNVTGLLTAIATVGFDGLSEAQEAALVGVQGGAEARLKAIGGSYIRYAVAHPARFRVIFGRMALDESDPALHASGSRALGILRRELATLRGEPVEGGDPDFEAAVSLAWSAVHGYATLLIDGHLFAINPTLDHEAYLGQIADRTLDLLVHAFRDRNAPPPRKPRKT